MTKSTQINGVLDAKRLRHEANYAESGPGGGFGAWNVVGTVTGLPSILLTSSVTKA